MSEPIDLDSSPVEQKEIYDEEKKQACLRIKRFNWLGHDNRATSFEFGADGFAGACNSGGELLHLSAPSKEHGLIFARGAFSSSLYACISRAQTQYGGSATFGLRLARDQVPYVDSTRKSNGTKLQITSQPSQEQGARPSEGSSFRLGEMTERGCFNYRWPLNEYSLLLNNAPVGKDNPDVDAGYCTRLSYFKDGVCYQVIRLEQRSWNDTDQEDVYHLPPSDGQVILEIGGSIYFQLFKNITTNSDENGFNNRIKDESSKNCLRIMDKRLNIGLEARVYQMNADGSGSNLLDLAPSPNQDTRESRQPPQPARPPYSNFDSSGSTFPNHTYSVPSAVNPMTEPQFTWPIGPPPSCIHPRTQPVVITIKATRFIAAIRLVYGTDTSTDSDYPEAPSSKEMHEDIWVEPVRLERVLESNSQATAIMWETILQWRDLNTDSMSEFTEISLMARCLEKILQVDLVPGFYGSENKALAVISNPFMRPTVSLRSLFWKVRFLAKVHHFLAGLKNNQNDRESRKGQNGMPENGASQQGEKSDGNPLDIFSEFDEHDRAQMINIATSQCIRIRDAIEGVISFLVELLLQPNSAPLCPQYLTDQSEFYYITMTIWYVVKSFRKTAWKSLGRLSGFKRKQLIESRIPPDNHNFGAIDKRKITLLKWYHYGSLLSLADRGILPPYWRSAMKKRVYSLSNAATIACTGSTDIKTHYSVDDEIVDRLSFLAHELGMEEFDATAETVTSASIQRIRGREFTKYLNPGIPLLKGPGYSFQETSGPWEIHALCHNSRVNVLTLESEGDYIKATKDFRGKETRQEEIALYKNKVYRFLNSEATLIPCWERSPTKMRSGWLQSEAAAVHGSTLLDIHNRIPVVPRHSPKISPQIRPVVKPEAPKQEEAKLDVGYYRGPAAGFKMGTLDDFHKGALSTHFQEILKELKGGDVRPIDWGSFRPPRQYYPDSFINSLEDTPHLFRPPITNNVFIPGTLTQFAKRPDDTGLGRQDLVDVIKEVQGSFTIVDILASQRIRSSSKHNPHLPDIRYYGHGPAEADGRKVSKDNVYVENQLVGALFDSLVDQSVQHRILHIHKLTEKLIQMLAGPTWMASITVGSWILTNTRRERISPKHRSVMANESVKLPKELKGAVGEKSALTLPQSRVSFFVSSVVLTTNAFGDFSRCSVISEVEDEDPSAEKDEIAAGKPLNEIWQVFVHQPQTARCLVFLRLLGMLCNKLCKQYRGTIKEFDFIVLSTDAFLLKEGSWAQDDGTLSRFQLILWSLDCLYKFQNSLKSSITNILDAKRELIDQIHEQAANRSPPLQGMCQEYIANFESVVVELTQFNEYLESNIAVAVRFKDALAGTLALRDSRVGLAQNEISLKQNNAIQALTYLTIGYLPLGLMAAIFAIPKEQNVVFQGMGKWWFVGSILILSGITYLVVACLNPIIDFFKFPSALGSGSREHRPNLWNLLCNIGPRDNALPR
ncbi:hypothetical protein EKO27_g4575 [Xylaria grammica]|uniref:Uncharacterized protein n=1 Tax=Xylaria grammica TaxID=363999 RepID=A0A439D7Y8_9PEZI|nr:hypothetical protein EKO27_g4575 [Xylaria grammica]